ncbi:phytoene desaturase family protein [Oceanirhabdus sp. W0125-5]|uniref:phytoene desaturase family protein n=1 Tax=Oceanirhabdus sp. W0125-5 TaxID=2999116 RepID=UPI0022F2F2E5|nr:phytoene desaturase family protein [Oceanirhabdus sp. W0125-5]WBW97008.1 phytoene desaturase family protein [Oceanirhabdus sp. W0125-5]
MKKNAIIVGAGIGGMATAIRLLNRGFKVQIFEKEKSIGGKVNILEKDGFKFDLTASILMTPDIYKEIFFDIGKNPDHYLNFLKIDPFYRVFFETGSYMDFYENINKTIESIEAISTEDSIGYMKFIDKTYEKYKIADENFLRCNFDSFNSFFNIGTLRKALKLKPLKSTYNYLKNYIKDERLISFLCFQAMYIGVSPFKESNVYTLIPLVSQLYGLRLIEGGMYSYINALKKVIEELEGEIYTNAKVDKVLIKEGVAQGIVSNNNIYKSDIVICNAEYSYAVEELIDEEFITLKDRALKHSPSVFIIYLGLDKKYENLKVHNHFLSKNFRNSIESFFHGEMCSEPSIYIYSPSRIDSNMAPNGCEAINVMIRVPNLMQSNGKWDEGYKKNIRNILIDKIKMIQGFEDIEEHIILEEYLTPYDLRERFNAYGGAAFSISHNLFQTNYFRPHIKHKKIKNLYFTGGSVHPGTGVSLVLLNSKLVEESVMRDIK